MKKRIIKALLLFIILNIISIFILSTIFYFNNIKLSVIKFLLLIIFYSSLSFLISNSIHKKGLICGIIIVLILNIILIPIKYSLNNSLNIKEILEYMISSLLGIIFSLCGVNFKQIIK